MFWTDQRKFQKIKGSQIRLAKFEVYKSWQSRGHSAMHSNVGCKWEQIPGIGKPVPTERYCYDICQRGLSPFINICMCNLSQSSEEWEIQAFVISAEPNNPDPTWDGNKAQRNDKRRVADARQTANRERVYSWESGGKETKGVNKDYVFSARFFTLLTKNSNLAAYHGFVYSLRIK